MGVIEDIELNEGDVAISNYEIDHGVLSLRCEHHSWGTGRAPAFGE